MEEGNPGGQVLRADGTLTELGDEPAGAPAAGGALSPGAELGGRYRIVSRIGAGGMGEVWRALDLKLRVEVALKAVRPDVIGSEFGLESLRREVRAAREVVSPNVCRIYDLEEIDGRELVSMEYVDGQTLLDVLRERGPLGLKEAQDIASQFLSGLEAIHAAGLVHRDVKPENIMLTRAGRVVVMDFGLARQESEGSGRVSGTPAYMAPEQGRGEEVDARADVYSAGVVLAEMVSPEGIKDRDSRESLWEGVKGEPPKLPDTPWAPVLKRALAKDREARYRTAHTLTRALEEVTLRVAGAEDLHPYPGLASFTEEDAEYFFGREAEVEEMWRKLEGPARLLGLVGPSGVGKTSFLRAGLIPRAGSGWRCLVCTPGSNPELSLSRALASELSGDAEAVERLLRFDDPEVAVAAVADWRQGGEHGLLIVDQLEELFTQNGAEVQQRFADLLNRLVLVADVHVLLSLRDDFLMRCHDHEGLKPLFSELTPLAAPVGANLRRALTQPALQCGYRFEDDALVEEMLAEVEGERGALPLLAFAAARLWEKRDRDAGLLTRRAYQDIGGVGGALARHAEATMDRIGSERIGIVRELFRNLVTAEGTRAVREWDELLSVFADSRRESAAEVLRELVDARLLTSYEIKEEDREPTRRVEIIHESLLANWPRLVRWQTQDADAVQLRDQLRQAARTWHDHGRTDDLLWTGSAFREYAVWRERYPGGLTELEEAFGRSMTSLATRRRRRRRVAVIAAMVVLVAVVAALSLMWRRSVLQTRRADANALFRYGQSIVGRYPAGAMGAALASLAIVDDVEVRRFAVEALQRGPKGRLLSSETQLSVEFSPNGQWLAVGYADGSALLVNETGEESAKVWSAHHGGALACFSPDSKLLFSIGLADSTIRSWSVPDGQLLEATGAPEGLRVDAFDPLTLGVVRSLLRVVPRTGEQTAGRSGWTIDSRPFKVFRRLREQGRATSAALDPNANRIAVIHGRELSVVSLDDPVPDPRPLARSDVDLELVTFHPDGDRVATVDASGRAAMWALGEAPAAPVRQWRGWRESAFWDFQFDPTGSSLVATDESGNTVVWGVDDPPDAEPLQWITAMARQVLAFHPSGRWLAETGTNASCVYPFDRNRYGWVLRGHTGTVEDVHFGPDGTWLVSASLDGTVRVWALDAAASQRSRVLGVVERPVSDHLRLDVAPDGRFVVVTTTDGPVHLLPLDGSPPTELLGLDAGPTAAAVSPDSHLVVAAGGGLLAPTGAVVRMWDLESGRSEEIDRDLPGPVWDLQFTADGSLLASDGDGALRRYDRLVDTHVVIAENVSRFDAAPDGRRLVSLAHLDPAGGALASVLDVTASTVIGLNRDLDEGFYSVAIDPAGEVVVSGGKQGVICVSGRSGGEPHLLYGHQGMVRSVAISPDGLWIASGSQDTTVRLWRVPTGTPVQVLSLRRFLDVMYQNCNYAYVKNPEAATGFDTVIRPFGGWAKFPEY